MHQREKASMKELFEQLQPAFESVNRDVERLEQRMNCCMSWYREMRFQASKYPPRRIIFCTKYTGLMGFHLHEDRRFDRVSFFWRGCPITPAHAALIACQATKHNLNVAFVGDLDPWDLFIYLSLGVSLFPFGVDVDYVGINSNWLQLCRRNGNAHVKQDAHLIDLDPFERAVFRQLQKLPVNWNKIIGRAAVNLLNDGQKLELEGATNPHQYLRKHRREVKEILLAKQPVSK
jgi:hypothetical protein